MGQIDLPDFDFLMDMINIIGSLSTKKENLELDIISLEARVVIVATTDEKYFVGGKPPSMSFVEATYKRTGFDGEIMQKRRELAVVSSELEVARKSFDLAKQKIEVWRSLQANERSMA